MSTTVRPKAPMTTTPQTPSVPGTQAKPTHEQIAMRAYERWCKNGRPLGTEMQDWLSAETELATEAKKTSR